VSAVDLISWIPEHLFDDSQGEHCLPWSVTTQ
jgi:hypothetical protein